MLSVSRIYGEIAFLGIGPLPEANQIARNSARVVDPDWKVLQNATVDERLTLRLAGRMQRRHGSSIPLVLQFGSTKLPSHYTPAGPPGGITRSAKMMPRSFLQVFPGVPLLP